MSTLTFDYQPSRTNDGIHPPRCGFLRSFSPSCFTRFYQLLCIYLSDFLHPAAFEGVDPADKKLRLISMILFTLFFPAMSLFLSRRLKLIKGLSLENRSDRLVGFIVTMIFYFWASYVFRNLPDTPPVALIFYSVLFSQSVVPGCVRSTIK